MMWMKQKFRKLISKAFLSANHIGYGLKLFIFSFVSFLLRKLPSVEHEGFHKRNVLLSLGQLKQMRI